MAPLEQLVREAAATAEGHVPPPPAPAAVAALSAAEAEVARVLQICNACRYCEGFCAVFPAMTRRLEFPRADLHYLANLCHNCGACLHACQYAPPHEFAVAVPRAMAQVRARTYAEHAWPPALGALYARNGLFVSMSLAAAMALFLVLALALTGTLWHEPLAGDFYRVFPHGLMAAIFAPVFGFALLALAMGVRRFWRGQAAGPTSAAALAEATRDVLRLKYLDGGHGEGCNETDDAFTLARRRLHHLTFYGFGLCFAATCVGTAYHYVFGWIAPYAFTSLPKLLGVTGGLLLAIGSAGLWRLRRRRHPRHVEPTQVAMDMGFIALLFGTATTGLLLTAWRDTGALALLLAVHLGFVMALFATMPYGKFAHGVYRAAALLKWAIEKRRPSALAAGPE
ncbi:tricarballylate utilization 4Fe-4S protein TcuB [uncultured Piscinibacter sp.]|uniref:tricarballylate utilization 4Fe-4S protein TcuB n=1 Tax=uncultured Piscinibacter sp. TaxID=1131835 RepID=UPI002623A895|nr:tricarballylate utilization 4Fe-4S protein TcuB [uncultured Piscinibacter sp.]